MRTVLVNVAFRDRYTNELYVAGKEYPMSEDRIKEVKEVNPNFITVIGLPEAAEPVVEPVEEPVLEPVAEPVAEPDQKKTGKSK